MKADKLGSWKDFLRSRLQQPRDYTQLLAINEACSVLPMLPCFTSANDSMQEC